MIERIKENFRKNHRSLFMVENKDLTEKIYELYEMFRVCFGIESEVRKLIVKTNNLKYLNDLSLKQLGKTVDFLIIEQFTDLPPNTLLRFLETVAGKGFIILLSDELNLGNFNIRAIRMLKEKAFIVKDVFLLDKIMKSISYEKNFLIDNYNKELKLTEDQDKILKNIVKILKPNCKGFASILASRGRGKTVVLASVILEAIFKGIDFIIITSFYIENIQPLYGFLLNLLKENFDKSEIKIKYYKSNIIKSINVLNRCSVDFVNIGNECILSCNLLIVDEAASIPLNYLKSIIKCKRVITSTTCDGYERTGRLFIQKFNKFIINSNLNFSEYKLSVPIRYGSDDWLEKLLQEIYMPICEIKEINKE